MRVFLLSVVCGVLLVATVQAKSDKAPPKQATPSASVLPLPLLPSNPGCRWKLHLLSKRS